MRLHEGGSLVRLFLQLLLSLHQVALQLVKAGIVHIADLHLRQRCQLAEVILCHLIRFLEDWEVGLLCGETILLF